MRTINVTDTEYAVLAYLLMEANSGWGEPLKDFDYDTHPEGDEALETLGEKIRLPEYEDDDEGDGDDMEWEDMNEDERRVALEEEDDNDDD